MQMATDLDREPNYDLVVEALAEKTAQGKLQWQETAEEGKFISAVKGERVFELMPDPNRIVVGSIASGKSGRLIVRDRDGKVLFVVSSRATDDLYRLVWRIVSRLDEKLEATYEILSHL